MICTIPSPYIARDFNEEVSALSDGLFFINSFFSYVWVVLTSVFLILAKSSSLRKELTTTIFLFVTTGKLTVEMMISIGGSFSNKCDNSFTETTASTCTLGICVRIFVDRYIEVPNPLAQTTTALKLFFIASSIRRRDAPICIAK